MHVAVTVAVNIDAWVFVGGSSVDAKARLSAELDEVRDTPGRVVITRDGRPAAVIVAVCDLEILERP